MKGLNRRVPPRPVASRLKALLATTEWFNASLALTQRILMQDNYEVLGVSPIATTD
jgi:hypothetical protein